MKIEYKKLELNDINDSLLDNFIRYQETTKGYFLDNGELIIKDVSFIDDWDTNKKLKVINKNFN